MTKKDDEKVERILADLEAAGLLHEHPDGRVTIEGSKQVIESIMSPEHLQQILIEAEAHASQEVSRLTALRGEKAQEIASLERQLATLRQEDPAMPIEIVDSTADRIIF